MDFLIDPPPFKKEKNGKTTLTFRVLPTAKIALSQKAKSLDTSLSEYVEILALGRHNELITALAKPPEPPLVEMTSADKELFNEFLSQLKTDFEDFSDAEILLACLIHAKENAGALWQRSLETFLDRVQTQSYHLKLDSYDD